MKLNKMERMAKGGYYTAQFGAFDPMTRTIVTMECEETRGWTTKEEAYQAGLQYTDEPTVYYVPRHCETQDRGIRGSYSFISRGF